MRDFTLKAYRSYIEAIQQKEIPFLRFDELMPLKEQPSKFCMARHDVDRKPQNALQMAMLEQQMGIRATYYFRAKPNTFKPDIIQKVAALGHEIGYHYESLSDSNGDLANALEDFEKNLAMFRGIVPIKTISMHGRPLKPYDNRDIWRIPENHDLLAYKFALLGEVYLDINYTDIAYINDTGRNWTSGESNRRDKVESNIVADFGSGEQLLAYLQQNPHPKMIFQIHPERWSDKFWANSMQHAQDILINAIKTIVR